MTTETEMTAAQALAKAEEFAQDAEEYIGTDSRRAEQSAAVSMAFAQIAQAKYASRATGYAARAAGVY